MRDVIAFGGDYFQDNQLELKWTLGEVVTERLEILSILLCQGFQQPNSKTTVPVIETVLGKLEIKVYPNPARDILSIEIKGNYLSMLTAKLYDLNGKEYKTEVLKEHISQIEIVLLPKCATKN